MQFSPDQLLKTTVHDKSGHKVGKVQQVYLDDATGAPSWVTVRTGIFGTNESLVPVDSAELNGDALQVPFDRQVIHDAPNFDPGHHLDESDEDELYRYYGLSSSGGTPGAADQDQTGDRDQLGDRNRPTDRDRTVDRDRNAGEMTAAAGEPVVQPGQGADRGDAGQDRPDRPDRPDRAGGEYVSGPVSAADREGRDQPPGSDSADRNRERDLLDRERDLLERERDLLEREREVAEQEGSVRPRLRRHDPGNR